MTEHDRDIIACFAAGNRSLRDAAIKIFREELRLRGPRRGDPYFDFMSEVDNPSPDLALRAQYRANLVGDLTP